MKNKHLKECANYKNGNCLGIMIEKNTTWIDPELAGKQCLIKQNKECAYFNTYVLPIIKSP